MCTFYILFYGRPEIVSKFRPFYHDMDFRVKAAHSVSCTHNIIFRNRCAEYTCITKLLLHTFSHIKHTAFFLVCYILSPDKRIGVMTEFGFLNPEKPDVPLNKNDAFQKVQKRRVQEKR